MGSLGLGGGMWAACGLLVLGAGWSGGQREMYAAKAACLENRMPPYTLGHEGDSGNRIVHQVVFTFIALQLYQRLNCELPMPLQQTMGHALARYIFYWSSHLKTIHVLFVPIISTEQSQSPGRHIRVIVNRKGCHRGLRVGKITQ